MRVDLFDFELPDSSIALRPVEPRDAARMLLVRPGEGLEDRIVRDLPDLLRPEDVLVLNDTRVIPSRLYGLRMREETAARVEIMLHKREGADRSEEHTSELQSRQYLVCRLLLEKKKKPNNITDLY